MRRCALLLGLLVCGCPTHAAPDPRTPAFVCGTDGSSPYAVDGVATSDPAFGTKRTSIELAFQDEARSAHWQPRARVRVASVQAVAGNVDPPRIRQALRQRRVGLRACHENSAHFDRASRYRVQVRVRWTAPDKIELLDGNGEGLAALPCVGAVLRETTWPRARPGSLAEITLVVSAQ